MDCIQVSLVLVLQHLCTSDRTLTLTMMTVVFGKVWSTSDLSTDVVGFFSLLASISRCHGVWRYRRQGSGGNPRHTSGRLPDVILDDYESATVRASIHCNDE